MRQQDRSSSAVRRAAQTSGRWTGQEGSSALDQVATEKLPICGDFIPPDPAGMLGGRHLVGRGGDQHEASGGFLAGDRKTF